MIEKELKILVVDDDKSNRKILNELLEDMATITLAKSGEQAVDKVHETKPDLILLDIVMPGMSGFEVLEVLKKGTSTQHIPVVFISGLKDAVDEEKGLELGAVDYIYKPFNQNIVKARVKNALKLAQIAKDTAAIKMDAAQNQTIQAAAEAGAGGEDATDEIRILVVDDERTNRVVLADLLSDEYTVMFAKNAQQALERVNAEVPPNLILLDIVMPDMDGYAVCKVLKDNPTTRDIPVIFVTGMQDEEAEKKGLDIGGIDYITKPFRPAIVRARVRNQVVSSLMRLELSQAHQMLTQKNVELERMAIRDPLTNLNNRYSLDAAMSDELNRSERYQRPFSIALLDIDHFKKVNDNYGHQVGDLVLQKFAQLLSERARESDIVGRWGGEEFLLICPETSAEGVAVFAESLRALIETEEFPEVSSVTASMGLATFGEGDTAESIIERADQALYEAKRLGRNRVEAA